jgi:hypothetical protein
MPCQWYVRGGGVGKRRTLSGQSVPPTPFGMAFGRLKLSPLYYNLDLDKNVGVICMSTHSSQTTVGQLTGPEAELVDLVIKNYR